MGLKQMTSSPQCWQSAAHFPADQHTELDEVPICLRSLQGYDWLLPALLIYLQMRIRAKRQNKGSDVIRFNLNHFIPWKARFTSSLQLLYTSAFVFLSVTIYFYDSQQVSFWITV